MAYGPFQTKEGSDTIAKFTKDELLPLIRNIEELAIKVSQFRVGFWRSFWRRKFSELEDQYKQESVLFIKFYHRWSTPDIFFDDLNIDTEDQQRLGGVMADYFQTQKAIAQHFNEGFRLLNYIDRILTNQSTASYNRVSISLGILAIVISIFVFISK